MPPNRLKTGKDGRDFAFLFLFFLGIFCTGALLCILVWKRSLSFKDCIFLPFVSYCWSTFHYIIKCLYDLQLRTLSEAKVWLLLTCFQPLLLENRKRYDEKAFYQAVAYARGVQPPPPLRTKSRQPKNGVCVCKVGNKRDKTPPIARVWVRHCYQTKSIDRANVYRIHFVLFCSISFRFQVMKVWKNEREQYLCHW